jgi:hypothetical protein
MRLGVQKSLYWAHQSLDSDQHKCTGYTRAGADASDPLHQWSEPLYMAVVEATWVAVTHVLEMAATCYRESAVPPCIRRPSPWSCRTPEERPQRWRSRAWILYTRSSPVMRRTCCPPAQVPLSLSIKLPSKLLDVYLLLNNYNLWCV